MFQLKVPAVPPFGADLPACTNSPETVELLLNRRSTTAKTMTDPGPDNELLSKILAAGARVPDHGKLAPWRFLLITDENRLTLGEKLAEIAERNTPSLKATEREIERTRFLRAPVVIVVISKAVENHKIPVWEQELSAGAVCQNMLIAANALGFASQWLTEWYAYDAGFKAELGLNAGERIAGFIYLGTASESVMERKRPDLHELVTVWVP